MTAKFRIDDYDETKQTGFTNALLEPGNHLVRILGMKLEVPPYDKEGEKRVLNILLEGEAMGGDFKGFRKNPDDESSDTYEGQIATVRHDKFDFNTFTTKTGRLIERDNQIFQWINNFALHIGKLTLLKNAKIEENTIEDYVATASAIICDPKNWIMVTIAGVRYKNKQGYDAFNLFFPKATKTQFAYAVFDPMVPLPADLIEFNAEEHVTDKKEKEPVPAIEEWETNTSASSLAGPLTSAPTKGIDPDLPF